jgi:hypothetical protein
MRNRLSLKNPQGCDSLPVARWISIKYTFKLIEMHRRATEFEDFLEILGQR